MLDFYGIMRKKLSIFWFRRDLRLDDNCGLFHALKSDVPILPIFIFDTNILSDLSDRKDARVNFIHSALTTINRQLKEKGSRLRVFHATPEQAFSQLLEQYDVQAVHTNRDYEPYALNRDKIIHKLLPKGVAFNTYKDQVVFEPEELLKADGRPYLVYTPYSKNWLSCVKEDHFIEYASGNDSDNWIKEEFEPIPSLQDIGFELSSITIPESDLMDKTIENYAEERDYPSKDGTSRLGIHYRFGTISIRSKARQANCFKEKTYLKELIWREFFMMILYFFPRVVDNNFNTKYDGLKWRNDEHEFEKWKNGTTGFPLVDAGMRELNNTGHMHNRVRMLVASFLTKHLLIDWKWGEAYFAEKLLDFELSSNNGNWQWAAGTGVDAQPYFRVFNPTTQIDKFDKERVYIRKWVSEYETADYPKPMVDHKMARERAIAAFKEAVSS